VSKFLSSHFTNYVDYDFTARLEDELDSVSRGEEDWVALMEKFWTPFKDLVEDKKATLDKADAGSVRVLGADPASGRPVSARIGKYGPLVQIGTVEDEEKPRFASLRPGQSIYTLSLDEAMELFKMPRKLGTSGEHEVSVGIGRFGPFAKRGSTYASLGKEDDPYSIGLERAVALIEEKEEIARNRIIKEFPGSDIQVLNGRFGPYLSDGKLNGKIPKDREPASLTLDEVTQLMAETGRPMRGRFGKKVAAKKAPARKATKAVAEDAAKPAKKAAKKTVKKAAKKVVKKGASKTPAKATKATSAAKKATKKVAKKAATVTDDDAPF
jgi:DNA topoisomerase-1